MLIHKFIKDITVSSGSGSENTLKFSGGLLDQAFCEATTTTNIYDFSLIDEDGDVIYSKEAIEGGFEEHALTIPLKGIITVSLTTATIDENIRVKLLVEE